MSDAIGADGSRFGCTDDPLAYVERRRKFYVLDALVCRFDLFCVAIQKQSGVEFEIKIERVGNNAVLFQEETVEIFMDLS